MPSPLLTERDVFEIYGRPFTPSWLSRKRMKGDGPAYIKLAGAAKNSRVFYRAEYIEAYIRDATKGAE